MPEGRGIFADLTVAENLLLGANPKRARDGEAARRERVLSLFPRLGERLGQTVRTMSGGEQQMVAIGRALMSNPDILLLDEPSLGLSPLLVRELFASLRKVRESGVGLLLVEQNARESLAIADRGYLIENGEIIGSGTAAELMSDNAVQRAYLGGIVAKRGLKCTRQLENTEDHAMNQISLLLENQDVQAVDGVTFDRLNPITGEVATRASAAQIADAKRAADAAAAAFPAWSSTGPTLRRKILLKAADAARGQEPRNSSN